MRSSLQFTELAFFCFLSLNPAFSGQHNNDPEQHLSRRESSGYGNEAEYKRMLHPCLMHLKRLLSTAKGQHPRQDQKLVYAQLAVESSSSNEGKVVLRLILSFAQHSNYHMKPLKWFLTLPDL